MNIMHWRLGFPWVALAAMLLVGVAPALAQTGQPSALEREFFALQERLITLQNQAMMSDRQLQDMVGEMEDLITDKMRAAGHDPGSIMETLLAAQGKLQDPNLSDRERGRIMSDPELQQAQVRLQAAEAAVVDDPQIVAARSRLEQAVLRSVRAIEPDVDRMLQRLEELQTELLRQRR
jgi:hypothetical protein